MDTEQLRQLVAISEQGTISAAAKHVHLSQPTLSRSVRRLEEELGHELFDRTQNQVRLNEAGRLAVECARDVLAAERRMHDALDEQAKRRRTLRVGSIAPAPTWELTSRVVEGFPGTILETELLDDEEIERRLFDRTIDLGITRHPLALPILECIPLMTESLYVSVPLSHPLAGRKSVSFSEIDGETFLVMDKIGFWENVHHESIPNATFIRQNDQRVFDRLAKSSDALHFSTNATLDSHEGGNRRHIPITDDMAHATFYLVSFKECPERLREIVDWVHKTLE